MYWGIPPEINAFRLTMMGAGPTAHVPVVAAYTDAAATHLEQATQQAVTTMATAPSFVGFGGAGMVSSATPMSAWMGAAGAHAGAAAATVQGAIAGYSTAVASTIPHPVVIENRLREAALVASNILGQNTPAIAEAEAEYAEFWAQNASAMMGYLATTTAAVDALSVPMAPLTDMTDPVGAASGLAGLVSEGIGGGVQALGSGVSAGGQGVSSAVGAGMGAVASSVAGVQSAGSSGVQALGASSGTGQGTAGTGMGTGILGAATASMAPSTMGTPSSSTPGTPTSPSAPGQGQGQGGQPPLGDSGQGLLNQVTEMAPQAMSAAESPLSNVAGLPAQAAGQFGGLIGPLSALTSGMSGGLGGGPGGGGPPPLSAASAPWSGLSGANGGFAGGGSDVSAALTKPSAGGLGGPVGLPGGWWANAAESGEDGAGPAAGLRSAAGAGRSAMAPGMYGPMGAVGSSGRGSQHAEVSEADKLITLGSSAHEAPVLTSEGVVHVGQGG